VPPHEGPQARLQLADLEGLHQVVVRARLEARDLVLERVPGGQHQDRRVAPCLLAQLAADDETVGAGQHDVEHDDVVSVGHRKVQAGDAVGGIVDDEAAGLEEIDDGLRDVAMILDQEDADLPGLVGHGLQTVRSRGHAGL